MRGMTNSIRHYIEKYYYTLHLEESGITENSALQDTVAACVDKAFEICIKGRAGEDYGIYKYPEEIMQARGIVGRAIMQFLTAESLRSDWFSALLEEIVGSCFAGYNLERANAETGRKVGFTYGNAQCLISVSLRNIMAYFTVCGINKYDDKFRRCYLPVDDSFYAYANKILRKYPDDVFCGDREMIIHIFSTLHWSEIDTVKLCLSLVGMADMLCKSAARFEEDCSLKEPYSALVLSCKISALSNQQILPQADIQKLLSDSNLSAVIDKLTRAYVPFGALYVLPDGRILDLATLPLGHEEFFEMTGLTAQSLSEVGWLRANTKAGYVQLPDCPLTAKQVIILEEIKKIAGGNLQIRR